MSQRLHIFIRRTYVGLPKLEICLKTILNLEYISASQSIQVFSGKPEGNLEKVPDIFINYQEIQKQQRKDPIIVYWASTMVPLRFKRAAENNQNISFTTSAWGWFFVHLSLNWAAEEANPRNCYAAGRTLSATCRSPAQPAGSVR